MPIYIFLPSRNEIPCFPFHKDYRVFLCAGENSTMRLMHKTLQSESGKSHDNLWY